MCEFNRPYLMAPGTHPDERADLAARARARVLDLPPPTSPWHGPGNPTHASVIDTAVAEAAAHRWDVHTWPHGAFIGIEFRPTRYDSVHIWDWSDTTGAGA